MGSHSDGHHSDANSTLSDLMDILLQEDSQSGTGSATSGSLGSGSNGCGTSASGTSGSGTGSSHVSNNSSKYFGSIDSSQNSHKAQAPEQEGREPFVKCVLQDPLWLLMADADESVMMTYQLPSRDLQKVLKEDRDRLHRMHKSQPSFTEQQKKELAEVHPWMKKGGLPQAINVKACACCEEVSSALIEEEPPDLEMGETTEEAQKGGEETQQAQPGHSPVAD